MSEFSREYRNSCWGQFCFNFFLAPSAESRAEAFSSQAATARSQHEHAMAQEYNLRAASEYSNAHNYRMAKASISEANYDAQKYTNENQPRSKHRLC